MSFLFWFFVYFMKYVFVSAVLGAIVGFFFPQAGLIVFGLFVLGGVVEAWKEAIAKRQIRRANDRLYAARFEIEGFNQALKSMQRDVG